ncbi:phosphatidylserine decarboxylase family protein [Paraburkholderia metrosideri]|uniref:Phosphatidylserine decarboxylase proenzyme 2 n=1 Tax=Paraburkholderia metrosideri TaxID=580937 RepID=A0ABN7HIQ2_9BURK|nr:phosphatidylserine decarboxylase family protein [Paraburkholderia metrosideri]CAD6516957.1 Phosphatidylserine decarboxylase proenzyme 2 [Paraburkholderia metrosideri]
MAHDRAQAQTQTERRRLGDWLPRSERHLAKYRLDLAEKARERGAKASRNVVVDELSKLISGDPVLRMDLTRAIGEARDSGYVLGYESIEELMVIVDYLMTYAPPFSETSLIHCPLNAVLDWPMCMPSGYALFRDPALNAQLKRVLNCWCGFLTGPHSREHLTTDAPNGWFSREADQHIGMSQFICDPDKPYWGFASWNHFFTRQFRDGVRPVAGPHDSKVIVSACEAAPYNLQHDVKLHDRFWIKSQPYSLQEMFTARHRDVAERFVGGSVYQAFLSAFNYHRWHAPVSGMISRAYLVEGSYYSNADSEGEDPGGLNDSQGYISAVAARAVIVIACDDAALGQVGCVFVGMADVSSCVIDALPGQHVNKGDELGFFQYGGSTCCLVFEPRVIQRCLPEPRFDDQTPVKVNAQIATAS